MTKETSFFDSIYNSKFYSIMNSVNIEKTQRREKLVELQKEIEGTPAYKSGEDKSFMISANTLLKKIKEALT